MRRFVLVLFVLAPAFAGCIESGADDSVAPAAAPIDVPLPGPVRVVTDPPGDARAKDPRPVRGAIAVVCYRPEVSPAASQCIDAVRASATAAGAGGP
ncbi:MAG: hypothetical protein ACT4PT_05520, partial [Methanobacteriota archaeon]